MQMLERKASDGDLMEDILWQVKAKQVKEDLKNGKRQDGRAVDEFRELTIETGISENAEGSARVKLGKTEVIAGVKLITGEPYPDSPDEGTISIGAELLPLASPEFEAGPPREAAIELARVVDRGIRESKTIDFKKLCIRKGELVWIAFIDCYAVNDDGNLFDATAIACIAALHKTKIPKLDKDDKIVKKGFSGDLAVEKTPLLTTFYKIGNTIVLDANLGEQKAADARVSIASTEDNILTAFQKGGQGTFNAKEIEWCIETAVKKAKDVRKKI